MLKIHKIINSTIFGLSSLTPMIVSCTSCSIGDDIQNIQLFPDSNTIRPGETIPIRAVVFPSGRRTNNLKWELVDNTHPEITIDNQGVLHASPNLAIPELENIRVRASAPSHSSVYTICDISILPLPTYDFQGFYNNEVRYLDLEHNICSMPLEKLDTFTYVTKEHINLFEMDFAPKPDPFKSFIDFKPIISGQSLPYQSFQLANGKYAAHGISWDGYDDGTWTDQIPSFTTYDPTAVFDQIIVSFACDPRIKLIINFNLFFNPREHDSAITNILYYPMDPNDIHTVKRLAENDYSCNLYCPAFAKTGIYTGTLSSIYCFRPKLEYMDYDFRIEPSSKLDPSIEEMLSITPGIGETFKPKMNIRPLDNFQYYSFDMDYTFTLTDREHTADYWNYERLELFTIKVIDPFLSKLHKKEYVACTIEFFLEWV